MFRALWPQDPLSEEDVHRGLRPLVYDAICAQSMAVLTGGAFLVAFALLLGASNKVIGLLAAIGPLTQILQIPSIFLVDRLRARKALVFLPCFAARAAWLVIAVLPWCFPGPWRLPLFLLLQLVYFGLSSVATCAFSSWMHDLIPENILGRYFATRLSWAVAVGAVLSLAAGLGVDLFKHHAPEHELAAYSVLFAVGAAWGLVGLGFLARVPEPRMHPTPSRGLAHVLAEPFRDRNFRALLVFLATWSFAVSFAAPFFTVYMLKDLQLSMSLITVLGVVSQGVNVVFFSIWGRLADRFTNKSVLTVSGPLFMVSFALWPFLTMPEKHVLTMPLLAVIHILGGMSSAGVALCAGNIALKAAPKGKATAYLATNALVCGIAATVAPILGGLAADWFAERDLSLTLNWGVGGQTSSVPALSLHGLEFLFVLSFLMGIYAVHRLLAVKEQGEVEERVVVVELYAEVCRVVKHVSNMAGLRHLTYFPYLLLKGLLVLARPGNGGAAPPPAAQETPPAAPLP